MASPSPNDNPRLNAVIAEIMKRENAGQRVDQRAVLEAYPDLAAPLQSYFQAKAMMAGIAQAETVCPKPPVPQLPTNVRETIRPGAVASDTASEFHSRSFGRYQLLRPLGEGAMGSVFLARDSSLDRQVALKIPKTDGKNMHEFVARFAREAKAAAGLKHPNICSVFDTGEHEGMPYITMEFIDGVPLSRFIGSSQLRSVDSVLQMVATIADAVGHAHSKGVIHRDLKPGNILVDADFRPIVTDFGLARRAGADNESRITQEGMLIGTPAYMAPEQVKGEQAKVGPRSDIYSLGVMLFEMLTLRLPFEAVDGNVPEMVAKILRDHPPSPGKFRKDLSEDVDDLCEKMLKKDPDKRFNSMPDVVTAIVQLREKLKRAPVSATDVARQQSPFEIQKAHIEQMLKKGQYAAAIQDLEKLAKETLPGAKTVAEWARTSLPAVRSEAKSLNPAGLAALLQTARELYEKHDYPGCIQLLDDIPSLRRTEAIEDLLEKAHARETEAEQLLSDIKDRERTQNLDGIEVLLKRFLRLKPGNSYAKRLWEALQSYAKTPATRRQYRFEKGRLQPMPEPGFLKQWAVLGSLVAVLTFLSLYYYVTVVYLRSDLQISGVEAGHDGAAKERRVSPDPSDTPDPAPIPLPTPPAIPDDRKLVETGTVPNKVYGKLEKDLPEPEAVLVGFDVTEGIVKVGFDAKVITSIKPLYRNNQGVLLESAKTYGVQNGAKKRLGDIPFYAVSAVRVVGAVNSCVDSIEVTFKPVDRFTDPLNPGDVITAKAGGTGGASCPILGQNGKQSVGLLVRSSPLGITGLGLLQPSRWLDAPNRETWIIRTGESFGHIWQYRTTDMELRNEWFAEDLSTVQRGPWSDGKGPFGQGIGTIQKYGTPWSSKYIYLRTTFEMPQLDAATNVVLRQVHDDDAWIWINGKEADLSSPTNPHSRLWGFQHQYADLILGDSVRSLLKPGKNTIAVKAVQNTQGQVIDIGLKLVPKTGTSTNPGSQSPANPAVVSVIPATPKPESLTAAEYLQRGVARYEGKAYAGAISDLEEAHLGDVNNVAIANNLAWYLATVEDFKFRDGKRAVELANLACRRTEWKNCEFLHTLACAYAESRDFPNAVKWQKEALKLAPDPEKMNYESGLNRFLGERPMPDSARKPIVLIERGFNGGHLWHFNHTRYTGSDWSRPGNNDDWPTGMSGFGLKRIYGNTVNTKWNKSDNEIYLRTQVRILSLAGRVIVLDSQHDDSAKIYVNGKLIIDFKSYGGITSYVFSPEKKAYFHEGVNDIAVRCTQRGDTNAGNPQVIDIGLRLE